MRGRLNSAGSHGLDGPNREERNYDLGSARNKRIQSSVYFS